MMNRAACNREAHRVRLTDAGPHVAELTVVRYLHGVRIDSFLVRCFRNYTAFRMQRIVRAGGVCVGGRVVQPDRRVRCGEQVGVRLLEPPDKLIEPEPLPLEILFEDDWLLVVNKPAGMAAHPVGAFQTGTLANAVQNHLDGQSVLKGLLRPGIVHRLDRQTSGVMAVTKDHLTHRRLSIDFQQGRVEKSYLALVEGSPAAATGTIELPVGQLVGRPSILMTAGADARAPRSARTDYEVVEPLGGRTLIRAMPRTGRIHQIRVHLAAIGLPIVGDEFYGPWGRIKPSRFDHVQLPDSALQTPNSESPDRHLLHAERLLITHPVSGRPVRVDAPVAEDMRRSIELARRSTPVPQRDR